MRLDRHAEALAVLVESADIARRLNANDVLGSALGFQAEALGALGRPNDAFACAEEALSVGRQYGTQDHVVPLHMLGKSARALHLPPPAGSSAATGAIHYFEAALRNARELTNFTIPDALLGDLSAEYEATGNLQRALEFAREAAALKDKVHAKHVSDLATAMHVRYDTERVRMEAEHNRALFNTERRRTELLSDANATLERLAVVGRDIAGSLDIGTVLRTIDRHVGTLLDVASLSVRVLKDGELHLAFSRDAGVPPAAQSSLLEPLSIGEQVLGVLAISSAREQAYGERERQILRTIAAYGAVALANVEHAREANEVRAELEREKMRNVLVHAGKLMSIGRLASGVVHEMSHPLATLGLLTDEVRTMHATGRADAAQQALGGLEREIARLRRLLRRLRDFSRQDPPRIAEHDLRDLLDDAKLLFQPRLSAERIEYREELDAVRVRVDGERLCLAITNIVLNAADAMQQQPERQITLWCRCTGAQEDGKVAMVELRIRDSGPGFSQTALEHLFEPFFTTKPRGQGLGLGLALSAESMTSFGARINVSNHPKGGAEVSLWLPRVSGGAGN
jgi:signal transduction histidine kinase